MPPRMFSRTIGRLFDRTSPSDWVILALLFTIAATFTSRLLTVPQARGPWMVQLGLLLAFSFVVGLMALQPAARWVAWCRAIVTVGVLLFLYSSLAAPVFAIIPWRADASLEAVDRALFAGHSPALWAAGHVGVAGLEFWSLIYGFFIPFLYISIFLGCVGRPPAATQVPLTRASTTPSLTYLRST